jgi:hypothetical protein
MESSSGRIEADTFSRNNFEMWKLKMEHLLINQDQSDIVDENIQRPTNPT